MALEHLGQALTASYAIEGGTARLYERGLTVDGAGGQVVIPFKFPMIGLPQIATGQPQSAVPLVPSAISFQHGSWNLAALGAAIQRALAGRLALLPTGAPPAPVALTFGAPVVVVRGDTSTETTYGLPSNASLQERQLYDVAVRGDDGQWTAIAPHAIYFRSSWHDFGIAHITDIHLARRIDYFPGRLEQLGSSEAAQRMYNWNDRFRGFIRYANYLHSIGVLDVILATGDIIDYIFEDDDDHKGGGNALFAREIILGQLAQPRIRGCRSVARPDLHDWRAITTTENTHMASCSIWISGPSMRIRCRTTGPYNVLWRDGLALSRGDNGDEVPERSAESAARMVEVDRRTEPSPRAWPIADPMWSAGRRIAS